MPRRQVQVRPANAAAVDFDDKVFGSRFRIGQGFEYERFAAAGIYGCFHLTPLQRFSVKSKRLM